MAAMLSLIDCTAVAGAAFTVGWLIVTPRVTRSTSERT